MREGYISFAVPYFRKLCFIAIVCLCCPWVHSAGWERRELPEANVKSNEFVTVDLPDGCHEFILEGQLGFGGNHMGGGLDGQKWTVELLDKYSRPVRRITGVYGTAVLHDGFSDSRFLNVMLDSVSSDGATVSLDKNELHNERELYGRSNTLTIDCSGGKLRVWLGKDGGVYVLGGEGTDEIRSLRFGGTKSMSFRDAAIKWRMDPARSLRTSWSMDEISEICARDAGSGISGKWQFLDRDTDVRWAIPGGRYTLAIIPHDVGKVAAPTVNSVTGMPASDIIYLSGAETNRSRWEAGMLKGHLYPTPFVDHYTLLWFDSFFEDMGYEASADLSDGAVLTFNFPLYKSVLRFVKMK